MFDRLIRLAEARGALRKGRFEQALELADDPLVRSHRRATEIKDRALKGLLERAKQRREGGGLSAALADISRILGFQPEYDGARSLKLALHDELTSQRGSEATAREMLREARQLAEAGELGAALKLCGAAAEVHPLVADERVVRQLIESRQNLAADLLAQATAAHRRRDGAAARDLLIKARAHERHLPGASELAQDVATRWAGELLSRLQQLRKAGDDAGAYALLSRERAALPELEAVAKLQEFTRDTAAFQTAQLRELLARGELEAAVEIHADLNPRLLKEPSMQPLGEAMGELARALDLRDRGDFGGAAECLGRVASEMRSKGIKACVAQLQAESAEVDSALSEARELAGGGRLVEARQRLTPTLERWPMHEAVRRQMEILDQGARDKEQRLSQARRLAKEGKLAEASASAVALAVPGAQGEEARLLLVEVQARIDLVRRGLDQVRRAVHGRHSGSAEGLRHCLLRLEQLAKVQTDSEDLTGLHAAVSAEVEGVELLDLAVAAMNMEKPDEVAERLESLPSVVDRLLRPDRLDARVLEMADRLANCAAAAAAAGRLSAARRWLAALHPVVGRHPDVRSRLESLAADTDTRQQRAHEAANRGERALAARQLAEAESCLEEARAGWVDGAPVLRLEADLRQVHGQRVALEEVERLTARQDYAEANRQLDHMSPTPGVLRTRIFDIKQGLARAQGLDGGFLLRVDEGGEYLVLRGDRVTIGNVREGQADLVVLANIAGRHAVIHRSMSFHGGMEDRICADRGEIVVGGRSVKEHVLKTGDRVGLGSALAVTYRIPSSRSLTAGLTLSSGFQVAGTDKILLMRDRGRDGRILIGPSSDAHVRVPDGSPEVEVFAAKDGQVRVRFGGKGSMDGRPFSGEHPVTAGALVRCGDLSFVLQPFSKAV